MQAAGSPDLSRSSSPLTAPQALSVKVQRPTPVVARRPSKRDILALMVAGCAAVNNWENNTS
jgi:hypothetical protein